MCCQIQMGRVVVSESGFILSKWKILFCHGRICRKSPKGHLSTLNIQPSIWEAEFMGFIPCNLTSYALVNVQQTFASFGAHTWEKEYRYNMGSFFQSVKGTQVYFSKMIEYILKNINFKMFFLKSHYKKKLNRVKLLALTSHIQ